MPHVVMLHPARRSPPPRLLVAISGRGSYHLILHIVSFCSCSMAPGSSDKPVVSEEGAGEVAPSDLAPVPLRNILFLDRLNESTMCLTNIVTHEVVQLPAGDP